MARRPRVPSYCKHSATGLGYARFGDHGRPVYFPGPYNSPQSRAAYDRALADWLRAGRRAPPPRAEPGPAGVPIADLVLQFWEHAEAQQLYYKAGRRTSEWSCLKMALGALLDLFAGRPAGRLGPADLDALKSHMAAPKPAGRGWAQGTIRFHVARVRSLLRWGEARGLVPPGTAASLAASAGLGSGDRKRARHGRPTARKRPPDPFAVGAVALAAGPPVCSMIWLQRLNGMRPGAVCAMRPCEIDISGPVWKYTESEETAAKTGREVHWLGPRAQAILRPYLDAAAGPDAFLFVPSRRPWLVRNPRFTRTHYARTVARLCKRLGVAHWHPNLLRRWHLQEVRDRFGLDHAQARGSHARADTTQVYAGVQAALAQRVAADIG